jgi:dipeptidyl aminopeptidase/acylaminoacyl peptidase
MLRRSPISYVDKIAEANLKIFHGKWDKSVPVSHSIDFYNELIARHPRANVYLDIFDGGHEMCFDAIELFILSQYNKKSNESLTG